MKKFPYYTSSKSRINLIRHQYMAKTILFSKNTILIIILMLTGCGNNINYIYEEIDWEESLNLSNQEWDNVYHYVQTEKIDISEGTKIFKQLCTIKDRNPNRKRTIQYLLDNDLVKIYRHSLMFLRLPYRYDNLEFIDELIRKGCDVNYFHTNDKTEIMNIIDNGVLIHTNDPDSTLTKDLENVLASTRALLYHKPNLLLKNKQEETVKDILIEKMNHINQYHTNSDSYIQGLKKKIISEIFVEYDRQSNNFQEKRLKERMKQIDKQLNQKKIDAKINLSSELDSWRNNLQSGDNVTLYYKTIVATYTEDWYITSIYSNGDYSLKSNSEYGTKKVSKHSLFPPYWSESKIKKYLKN